jgi:hypothetical protein
LSPSRAFLLASELVLIPANPCRPLKYHHPARLR